MKMYLLFKMRPAKLLEDVSFFTKKGKINQWRQHLRIKNNDVIVNPKCVQKVLS